jgi:NDP-sugar pyrophosphorylase family protein
MRADELFAFPESMPFGDIFTPELEPWEWVKRIKPALHAYDFEADERLEAIPAGVTLSGEVWLHPSVRLPAFCVLEGPAWIGPEVQIRPGAYVRGNVIVGAGSCLGNSCEYKNCLLLERVETPHYNYVGDSVLGNRAHLGAGAICANLKLARDEVSVALAEGGRRPTGLRKLGALLGDAAEVGCNAVLNPGAILGRRALVMPGTAFSGTLPAESIALVKTTTKVVRRLD